MPEIVIRKAASGKRWVIVFGDKREYLSIRSSKWVSFAVNDDFFETQEQAEAFLRNRKSSECPFCREANQICPHYLGPSDDGTTLDGGQWDRLQSKEQDAIKALTGREIPKDPAFWLIPYEDDGGGFYVYHKDGVAAMTKDSKLTVAQQALKNRAAVSYNSNLGGGTPYYITSRVANSRNMLFVYLDLLDLKFRDLVTNNKSTFFGTKEDAERALKAIPWNKVSYSVPWEVKEFEEIVAEKGKCPFCNDFVGCGHYIGDSEDGKTLTATNTQAEDYGIKRGTIIPEGDPNFVWVPSLFGDYFNIFGSVDLTKGKIESLSQTVVPNTYVETATEACPYCGRTGDTTEDPHYLGVSKDGTKLDYTSKSPENKGKLIPQAGFVIVPAQKRQGKEFYIYHQGGEEVWNRVFSAPTPRITTLKGSDTLKCPVCAYNFAAKAGLCPHYLGVVNTRIGSYGNFSAPSELSGKLGGITSLDPNHPSLLLVKAGESDNSPYVFHPNGAQGILDLFKENAMNAAMLPSNEPESGSYPDKKVCPICKFEEGTNQKMYCSHFVGWAKLDPRRLVQIRGGNLLTNILLDGSFTLQRKSMEPVKSLTYKVYHKEGLDALNTDAEPLPLPPSLMGNPISVGMGSATSNYLGYQSIQNPDGTYTLAKPNNAQRNLALSAAQGDPEAVREYEKILKEKQRIAKELEKAKRKAEEERLKTLPKCPYCGQRSDKGACKHFAGLSATGVYLNLMQGVTGIKFNLPLMGEFSVVEIHESHKEEYPLPFMVFAEDIGLLKENAMNRLQKEFGEIRKVSTPWCVICTTDYMATIATLLSVQIKGKLVPPAVYWDCVKGPVSPIELNDGSRLSEKCKDVLGDEDTPPHKLLEKAIEVLPADGILFMVLPDQTFLDNSFTIQGISNVRDAFKSNGRTLVLLGLNPQLPAFLAEDIPVLEDPLPTKQELEVVVKGVAAIASVKLKDDAVEAAAIACLGMPRFPAEEAVARKLRKEGIDMPGLREVRKKIIEESTNKALLFEKETWKFDQIGGQMGVKSLMQDLYKGKKRPSLVVRIDEIDKSISAASTGTVADNTGVSQDILKTVLTTVESNKWYALLALGGPGTGKTLFSICVGNEFDIPCLSLDLGGVKASLVGESEQRIRRVMNTIYTLGGENVLVIATANRTDTMPGELLRRFWLGTYFWDALSAEERAQVWVIQKARYGHPENAKTPNDEGWTGSDIKKCCEMAFVRGISLMDASKKISLTGKASKSNTDALRKTAEEKGYLSASTGEAFCHTEVKKAQRQMSV